MPTLQELMVAQTTNSIISMAGQLFGLAEEIGQMSTLWTNMAMANKLNAFPTAALTTTGGLGAADTTPNPANPINTGVYPGNQISHSISANNVASLLTYLQGVQLAINGTAVSANGAAASLLPLTL